MIKSMTGYAAAEVTDEDITVTVDIRAYNSRHLDIVLRLPSRYLALEEKMKGIISQRIVRGRLEVKIQVNDTSEGSVAFEVDWGRAEAMHGALAQLSAKFDLDRGVSMEHLLSVGGMIKPVEKTDDADGIWRVAKTCLDRALNELESMRCKEGEFIAADLSARLDFIETCLANIKSDSSNLIAQYTEKLKERMAALTQETVELDPGRLAQEAAFLADRSDISEEVVRGESHVQQFRHIMGSEEPGGRKLNFLLQELHREFNTIGSKIGHADTAHRVVDVKAELEKIREQIQNVE